MNLFINEVRVKQYSFILTFQIICIMCIKLYNLIKSSDLNTSFYIDFCIKFKFIQLDHNTI